MRLPPEATDEATGSAQANRTELSGTLLERGSLRYTPAGIPVIEFRIAHHSEQREAGIDRRVECEIACIALGTTALLLKDTGPGIGMHTTGFLAARSLKQKTPVLHVTRIDFTEHS